MRYIDPFKASVLQSKANHWFLYETQHRAEIGQPNMKVKQDVRGRLNKILGAVQTRCWEPFKQEGRGPLNKILGVVQTRS